jgi:hypothetical protein
MSSLKIRNIFLIIIFSIIICLSFSILVWHWFFKDTQLEEQLVIEQPRLELTDEEKLEILNRLAENATTTLTTTEKISILNKLKSTSTITLSDEEKRNVLEKLSLE